MKGISWLTVCAVFVSGASSVEVDVSVNEGDSVTLNTDAEIKQQDRIKWFYKNTRISQINGDLSQTCIDVQCNEGTERFTGRLKLDPQTGSLTIMNINTADSGPYKLQLMRGSSSSENNFNISVSAAERIETKTVKEGDLVILNTSVLKKPNDVMTWTFNGIVIAKLTGNECHVCSDDQCQEIFEKRLKLDRQIGSLNITNTRSTDSGVYKLEITSIRANIRRRRRSVSVSSVWSFSVSVIDSKTFPGPIAGICVFLLVVIALILAGIYHRRWICKRRRNIEDNL